MECVSNVCQLKFRKYPNCNKHNGILLLKWDHYFGQESYVCTCLEPDIFTGVSCDEPSPLICYGGKLNEGNLGWWDRCTCSERGDRQKMNIKYREKYEIPMCLTEEEQNMSKML